MLRLNFWVYAHRSAFDLLNIETGVLVVSESAAKAYGSLALGLSDQVGAAFAVFELCQVGQRDLGNLFEGMFGEERLVTGDEYVGEG